MTKSAHPLVLFHHLAKNAGTSLRQLLVAEYGNAYREFYGPAHGADAMATQARSLLDQLHKIRCIAGHNVHWLLPELQRSGHAFVVLTLLREPVDRAVSRFHFARQLADQGGRGRGRKLGQRLLHTQWSLADVFDRFGDGSETDSPDHELFKFFFNGQVRALLAPLQDVAKALPFEPVPHDTVADAALQLLSAHYLVGDCTNLEASVRRFADALDWRQPITTLPRTNMTRQRPSPDALPVALRDLVSSFNQADASVCRSHGIA